MTARFRRIPRRLAWCIAALLGATVALGLLFPGQRLSIALTVATGIGRGALQRRIDVLEDKAIGGVRFSAEERAFLADFYGTLATGAKLTIIVRQTGRLMDHYLAGTGSAYRLEPAIFTNNAKVQQQADILRRRAARAPCRDGDRWSSPTFYMPDASQLDSVFGLYHGQLHATQRVRSAGTCRLDFRAEVPWVWPSYASLGRKYGTPHAESFPLPSLRSLLLGREHALFVDNGLGAHLEAIGLAKSFLAYAEWPDG